MGGNPGGTNSGGMLGGFLDDPNTMSMLGLLAGVAKASGPSRLPVGLGQVLGSGLQGMAEFGGQAQQHQLLNQEIQKGNLSNAMALWQLQLKKSLFDQAGFPSPALPTLPGQSQPSAASPDMTGAQAFPSGGNSMGGQPALQSMLAGNPQAPAPQGGQSMIPGMSPQMLRGGIIANEMGLGKLYAQQNPPPLDIEREVRAMGIDPASPQGQQAIQQFYLNQTNDPAYKAKAAGMEAEAKVPAALRQRAGEEAIGAQYQITPTDVITPDGPQSIPLTQAQRLAIANNKAPGWSFAPNPTPLNQQALTDQQKTTLDPARKSYNDNEQTKATIRAVMELGNGLTTGNLTEHITHLNNYLQSAGLPQIDPKSFDTNTAAALLKTTNQLVLNRIQTAAAAGGSSNRGNKLLMQIIQGSKPNLDTPSPALQGIGQNMIDAIDVDQARNKSLLNDATKFRKFAQPLPDNWESNYWDNYNKQHPGWDTKQAQKFAESVKPVAKRGTSDPLGIR